MLAKCHTTARILKIPTPFYAVHGLSGDRGDGANESYSGAASGTILSGEPSGWERDRLQSLMLKSITGDLLQIVRAMYFYSRIAIKSKDLCPRCKEHITRPSYFTPKLSKQFSDRVSKYRSEMSPIP